MTFIGTPIDHSDDLVQVSIKHGVIVDNRQEYYPVYYVRRYDPGTREYYERQTTYGK